VQLVILAAGHGRRFGGLKQLAPVGPTGAAIMDYTAQAAEACGFTGVVVVVREEIRRDVTRHLAEHAQLDIPIELVCQPALPGTAHAVLCTSDVINGPFAVANADDLYGEAALRLIAEHFAPKAGRRLDDARSHEKMIGSRHVLVAYQLSRTILTSAEVKRGICNVDDDGKLVSVAEHRVVRVDENTFEAVPLGRAGLASFSAGDRHASEIAGSTPVSMNLWGFHPRIFDELADAVAAIDSSCSTRPELLLPDVVGALVARGDDEVHVVETSNRCIGVTHREDLDIVRGEVARESKHLAAVRAAQA